MDQKLGKTYFLNQGNEAMRSHQVIDFPIIEYLKIERIPSLGQAVTKTNKASQK
jgi:hypothetical protein